MTHADLDYEANVTINQNLLEAANILPNEEVHIWNVTRGTRLSTYALEGDRGSGIICINGAVAYLCRPGDLVILATFVQGEEALLPMHRPTVVLVDDANGIKDADLTEIPGSRRRA